MKLKLLALLLFLLFKGISVSQTLQWAKQLQGTGFDDGLNIINDRFGNIYVTGYFSTNIDLDPGIGTYIDTAGGTPTDDFFLCKLNANGIFLWGITMHDSWGISIKTDELGDIYVTGFFDGTVDFDPGLDTFNQTATNGGRDIFIIKLDSSANFIWAKQIGGNSNDYPTNLALDTIGNLYICGSFYGTIDFDPGISTFNLTSPLGNSDVYILKIDTSGNFIWVNQLGGNENDFCTSIYVNKSGNEIYTTGYFSGTADFNPGPGVNNLSSIGNEDIFISKLNNSGGFIWAQQVGSSITEQGLSIINDVSGNVIVSGYFLGLLDFNPGLGTYYLSSFGNSDIFVLKLDASGNFIWAKQMGGPNFDLVYSITTDSLMNIYLTGYFEDVADFNPNVDTFNLVSDGDADIFICNLDLNGELNWATKMSGLLNEHGTSIVYDMMGSVYLTGSFNSSTDFDPSAATYSLTSAGGSDVFICKLNPSTVLLAENNNPSYFESLIFPNPTKDLLSVVTGYDSNLLEIFTITGHKIYQSEFNKSTELDISSFGLGVYLLKVSNGTKSWQKKIVKY